MLPAGPEGPPCASWSEHPYLKVAVSRDGLRAEVSAARRPEDRAPCTVEELRDRLEGLGIRHGVLRERLKAFCLALAADVSPRPAVVVAEGTPSRPGSDGTIAYHFQTDLSVGKVVGEDDDTSAMDFRDRGAVQNVRTGTILAEVTPPTAGEPGVGVRGERLEPIPGRWPAAPEPAENVERTEDARIYRATADGHVVLGGGQLRVRTVYERAGDLDYQDGNIDFLGDVRVGGSVASGFTVRCDGSLYVGKDLARGSVVRVGRDLTVGGAIRTGKDGGEVTVGGDLLAGSIENAVVRVVGDARVRELVQVSEVYCRGRFSTLESGSVRGSLIEAVRGIDVASAGSENGPRNTLIAGLTLEVARRLKKGEAEVKELVKSKEHIYQGFATQYAEVLSDRGALGKLPKEERDAFHAARVEAQSRQQVVDDRIHGIKETLRALEERVLEDRSATLVVRGDLFPPCDVAVGESETTVRRAARGVAFFRDRETGNLRVGTARGAEAFSPQVEEAREGAQDLAQQVTTRRIAPKALERELERAVEEGGAAQAIRLGRQAMTEKRYQTTRLFNVMGRAFMDHLDKVPAEARGPMAAESVEMFKQALRKDPDYVPALSNLGAVLGVLGRADEAIRAFEKAAKMARHNPRDPESNRVFYNYGVSLVRLARSAGRASPAMIDKALAMLEVYLAQEPEGEKSEDCRRLMQALRSRKEGGKEGGEEK